MIGKISSLALQLHFPLAVLAGRSVDGLGFGRHWMISQAPNMKVLIGSSSDLAADRFPMPFTRSLPYWSEQGKKERRWDVHRPFRLVLFWSVSFLVSGHPSSRRRPKINQQLYRSATLAIAATWSFLPSVIYKIYIYIYLHEHGKKKRKTGKEIRKKRENGEKGRRWRQPKHRQNK